MRASSLVAESLWKSIESTRSGLYICNFALLTHNLSVEFLMFTCTNDFITVSEDQLSTLYFLFGKNLEKATRIVDQKGVKTISGYGRITEERGVLLFCRTLLCLLLILL
ncbi:uncharacterized protein LOC116119376 isoform X5 [Pistacia vera]|uniref:uncharacterized protein LOC116119376 isoform X5 n=1 Tax=Pistacia vera TaxID=55513 RepID=UPI001262FCCB|nr:uncharacterized protein LOC116119376 isoform X5 [Pistacia vera]